MCLNLSVGISPLPRKSILTGKAYQGSNYGAWLQYRSSLGWITIKLRCKMCSFITQHNASDFMSPEEAWIWQTDRINIHQDCCNWIKCSFHYHAPSKVLFLRNWQNIQLTSQSQTMCNPASPEPLPERFSKTIHLHSWRKQSKEPKNYCMTTRHLREAVSLD